ncbi:hypothetical protein D9615_009924 [Tricholomella constricta]|uniref:Prolyl 4-hydroxylase alpha subunit domain-containing protein n=1 Tax=Tricholomella constricta TaxID=117010 RepID=A0A8H5LYF9_9AGAR|nr:hypothetical protein D9615_009924 [Tricholomella constricta]
MRVPMIQSERMARIHSRSPSPDSAVKKKKKKSHPTSNPTNDPAADPANASPSPQMTDPTSQFANDLFDHNKIMAFNAGYVNNEPFKYAIVEKLFQDELLKKVRDECLSELNFTEKETDIFQVNRTEDLASLTESQISLLPSLFTLRNALHSAKFRFFLQTVTGCGPLSGKKLDMSVNSYTTGCHLLSHNDVIGTRRVSYILYMPLPHYTFWQKDWGGAFELYPVKMGADGHLEPETVPSKAIPPTWNQFIFFEVQAGKSFHSVEEVVVGREAEDERKLLSISGWFHAAQEGEEGYIPETVPPEVRSSREQLTSTSIVFSPYPEFPEAPHSDTALSEEHICFLSEFLNPVYLQPRTMKTLSSRFADKVFIELECFLANSLAESLQPRLSEIDSKDGLGEDRAGRIPPHSSGTQGAWTVKGPPHKWRYCSLKPREAGAPAEAVIPRAAQTSSDEILRSLQDELFPSPAFRAWLAMISNLVPLGHAAEARRFRPGLDYMLATSEEKEARLDVVLSLTPEQGTVEGSSNSLASALEEQWGGWVCYMAPHNEEDDPAVYRSGTSRKSATNGPALNGNGHASSSKGKDSSSDGEASSSNDKASSSNGKASLSKGKASSSNSKASSSKGKATSSQSKASLSLPLGNGGQEMMGEEGEKDSALIARSGFNCMHLALRGKRVMRFVKYVSAAAKGSRWDVCGEYEVNNKTDFAMKMIF